MLCIPVKCLLQKVAITGTLLNPVNFKRQFEVISALLSLFDLQEKINNRKELLETSQSGLGSGILSDAIMERTQVDDIQALAEMQVLLENVIQDSCAYVSQVAIKLIIAIAIAIDKHYLCPRSQNWDYLYIYTLVSLKLAALSKERI